MDLDTFLKKEKRLEYQSNRLFQFFEIWIVFGVNIGVNEKRGIKNDAFIFL